MEMMQFMRAQQSLFCTWSMHCACVFFLSLEYWLIHLISSPRVRRNHIKFQFAFRTSKCVESNLWRNQTICMGTALYQKVFSIRIFAKCECFLSKNECLALKLIIFDMHVSNYSRDEPSAKLKWWKNSINK